MSEFRPCEQTDFLNLLPDLCLPGACVIKVFMENSQIIISSFRLLKGL